MDHPAFRNPPIVEAVAALRFAPGQPWPEGVRQAIIRRMKESYPGEIRQEVQIEVQAHFSGPDATTTTKSVPARMLMTTTDGTGLLGLGANVLTVHVLRPYPGWTAFEARIREAAIAAVEESGAPGLLEVAVRYIDRIALPPGEGANLAEYFTAIPTRPENMPSLLSAFQCITEARDPDTGTIAVLTTAAVPPAADESFVMLYDLNLLRLYPAEAPLPVEDYLAVLNDLHDQQYRIFMDSVSGKTKELFQ